MKNASNLNIKSDSTTPIACLWCKGKLGEVKYHNVRDRLGYVPGTWDLIECSECKSLVLSPFPSTSDIGNFYPEKYNIPSPTQTSGVRKLVSFVESKFLNFLYQKEARALYRKLPVFKKPSIKILEFGCGNGNRLEFFHNLKFDIVGVDMSRGDIEAIQSKGMKAQCIDIQTLPEHFEPNSFDVIMCFDVLEHIPNLEVFFSKILPLIRPGGWIVAGLPAQDSIPVRVFKEDYVALNEVPRHVSVPSVKGTEKFFHRFGLQNLEVLPYSALSCAIAAGLSLFKSASAHTFYSDQIKLFVLLKRLCGVFVVFIAAPVFLIENHFTSHPSRFISCAQKQNKKQ